MATYAIPSEVRSCIDDLSSAAIANPGTNIDYDVANTSTTADGVAAVAEAIIEAVHLRVVATS